MGIYSIVGFFQKGGMFMYPILVVFAVGAAIAAERWVLDGNYRAVRPAVWTRASTLVWLDLPFPMVFTRALLRTARRIVTREPLFNGNRESLRAALSWETLCDVAAETEAGRAILDAARGLHESEDTPDP